MIEQYYHIQRAKTSDSIKDSRYDSMKKVRLVSKDNDGIAQKETINCNLTTTFNNIVEEIESGNTNECLQSKFDNLSSVKVTETAMALFYYSNGKKLPQIYDLIYPKNKNLHQNTDFHNRLKLICNAIIAKLSTYRIDKKNTLNPNQENFHKNLLQSASNAVIAIEQVIRCESIKNTPAGIVKEFNSFLLDIEKINRTIKGGGILHNEIQQATDLKIKGLSDVNAEGKKVIFNGSNTVESVVSNVSFNMGSLTSQVDTSIIGAAHGKEISNINAGISASFDVLAAVITVINQSSKNVCDAVQQVIGIQKERGLVLYDLLLKSGHQLTDKEHNFFEKFLEIKRGNGFDKFFGSFGDTNHTTQLKQIRKNHESNRNKTDTKSTNDPIKPQKSHVEIENSFKDRIIKQHYDNLKSDIDRLNPEQKKYVVSLIFDIDGFRGNLLAHILNNPIEKNEEWGRITYKNALDEIIEIHKNEKTVKDILGMDYFKIIDYLNDYSKINKYDALIDFTNIILAIELHTGLSPKQKEGLKSGLQEELNKKDMGKFKFSRVKQNSSLRNLAATATAYQGATLSSVAKAVATDYNATALTLGASRTVASGVGYAVMGMIPSAISYFGKGNTTTYKSLQQTISGGNIQRLTKFLEDNKTQEQKGTEKEDQKNTRLSRIIDTMLEAAKQNSPEKFGDKSVEELKDKILGEAKSKDISEIPVTSINELEVHISLKDTNVQTVRDEINEAIKQDNPKQIFSTDGILRTYDYKILYYALTQDIDGVPLLHKLYERFPEEGYKDLVTKTWQTGYRSYIGKDKITELGDLSKFKQHIAKIAPQTPTEALLNFYEVMALISYEPNKESLVAKIEYFTQIISRVEHDITSNWHNLRLTNTNLITALNITNSVAYGMATTTIFLSAAILPLTIALLALATAVRGVVSVGAKKLTYRNTTEYKIAKKYSSDLIAKLSNPNKQALKTSFKNQSGKIHFKGITDILESRDKHQYSITNPIKINNFSSLNEYLKQYDFENRYQTDYKYINNTSLQNVIDDMISNITSEVTDKYTANESLFRIARIIKLADIKSEEKIKLLCCLTSAFNYRLLEVSRHLSKDRDLFRIRNYFAADIINTTLGMAANGIYATPISGVYQTIAGGSSDTLIGFSSSLLLTNSSDNNTKSFAQCMAFLKTCIIDEMQVLKSENPESENLKEIALSILAIPTNRMKSSIGTTTSVKNYNASMQNT